MASSSLNRFNLRPFKLACNTAKCKDATFRSPCLELTFVGFTVFARQLEKRVHLTFSKSHAFQVPKGFSREIYLWWSCMRVYEQSWNLSGFLLSENGFKICCSKITHWQSWNSRFWCLIIIWAMLNMLITLWRAVLEKLLAHKIFNHSECWNQFITLLQVTRLILLLLCLSAIFNSFTQICEHTGCSIKKVKLKVYFFWNVQLFFWLPIWNLRKKLYIVSIFVLYYYFKWNW